MTQIVPITERIKQLAKPFEDINTYGMDFKSEALFAKQQITANDYIFQAAQNSPNALGHAILNVAAIGISLNPATQHAYLVPRSPGKDSEGRKKSPVICLDISYRGLVKLATDAGAIEWAKSELVYEGDTFRWRSMTEAPIHEFDPFETDRMDIKNPFKGLRGGYCVAKLTDGTLMVDRMTADELIKIRDTSMAAQGPWKSWPEEMLKKALIKRARKSWPEGPGKDRVSTAVHILNEHEGLVKDEPVDEEKLIEFLDLVATGTPVHVLHFMANADDKLQAACYNTAPKGEKVKFKERVKGMLNAGNEHISEYVDSIASAAENEDPMAIALYDELDELEREIVDKRLSDITHRQIDALREHD